MSARRAPASTGYAAIAPAEDSARRATSRGASAPAQPRLARRMARGAPARPTVPFAEEAATESIRRPAPIQATPSPAATPPAREERPRSPPRATAPAPAPPCRRRRARPSAAARPRATATAAPIPTARTALGARPASVSHFSRQGKPAAARTSADRHTASMASAAIRLVPASARLAPRMAAWAPARPSPAARAMHGPLALPTARSAQARATESIRPPARIRTTARRAGIRPAARASPCWLHHATGAARALPSRTSPAPRTRVVPRRAPATARSIPTASPGTTAPPVSARRKADLASLAAGQTSAPAVSASTGCAARPPATASARPATCLARPALART